MTLQQAEDAMVLAHIDHMDNEASEHFWNLFVEARQIWRDIRDER